MIRGIGTDICSVIRIQAAFDRYGNRFVNKILGDEEQKIWRYRFQKNKERGILYLATRFSAKESFSKAIGLGMHMPMTWRRCEILNAPSGAPLIVLNGALEEWFNEKKWKAHVTLSDEKDHILSFVVVESV